jgi:hypothetical protein
MEYSVAELADRASQLGDELATERDERGASDLYQIEKSLRIAARKLSQLKRALSS